MPYEMYLPWPNGVSLGNSAITEIGPIYQTQSYSRKDEYGIVLFVKHQLCSHLARSRSFGIGYTTSYLALLVSSSSSKHWIYRQYSIYSGIAKPPNVKYDNGLMVISW